MVIHWLALSLAITQPTAALPAQPPLLGSGPWTVLYAESMCAMGRKFDGAGGPMTMVVKAPLTGGDYTFTIARQGTPKQATSRGEGRLLRAGEAPSEAAPMESFTSPSNQRISRFTIDGESFRLRSNNTQLTIDMGKEGQPTFVVNGLPKALDKLEECTRGLRKGFGIDQQLLDRVTVPFALAMRTPTLFTWLDYPQGSLVRSEQGSVGALFYIETNGRVRDCKVIESSRWRELDNVTCNVIRARLRATPAKDAQGKALRVPSHIRVNWVLPQ